MKKDVTINLDKMSENEYKIYSSSSEIIVKNFSLKISGDTAKINKKTYHSKDHTFNFEFKKRFSDFVLDCCNTTNPTEIRERIRAVKKVEPKIQTASKGKPIAFVKTLNVLINESWTKCKRDYKASSLSVDIDDLIMAKMSTYSPWPARLDGFTSGKKRAQVFFFGSSNTGQVNISEIVPFNQSTDVIRLLLLRKVGDFHKGVAEIESIMEIPPHLSLLRQLNAIENA